MYQAFGTVKNASVLLERQEMAKEASMKSVVKGSWQLCSIRLEAIANRFLLLLGVAIV